MSAAVPTLLLQTPLHALHHELGARMVAFAGYSMPVQYRQGVLKEHLHTRQAAGLFDVSHMGQLRLSGRNAAAALETLVPVDLLGLEPGQQRYAMFTDMDGGILDDLMVTRAPAGDDLLMIVNASRKADDIRHLRSALAGRCELTELADRALLALQGPAAAAVMQRLAPGVDFSKWSFMRARDIELSGIACFASRSGYTGEDGFEISVAAEDAETLARALLAEPEVAPIGLGARDSLRLEAGLCLYGHDIGASTTPVEAGLSWAIQKVRRAGGERAGGFPGAGKILDQLQHGVARKRVGLIGLERTPVREGSDIVDADGTLIGQVTSGGVGPSAGSPVALAYLQTPYTVPGTEVLALVRDKRVPMRVATTPFVPNGYYRG